MEKIHENYDVTAMKLFFLSLVLCSRKASMKDKVFPSPSKAPVVKGKVLSPGAEDGAEASPSKVAKSGSFNEKNRGQKHALKVRGSTSRQNSEGKNFFKNPHKTQSNQQINCIRGQIVYSFNYDKYMGFYYSSPLFSHMEVFGDVIKLSIR